MRFFLFFYSNILLFLFCTFHELLKYNISRNRLTYLGQIVFGILHQAGENISYTLPICITVCKLSDGKFLVNWLFFYFKKSLGIIPRKRFFPFITHLCWQFGVFSLVEVWGHLKPVVMKCF